ncbi:NtaA/DmoA family FMN-dependent monooxygenase [Frankia gtarii]|uniref:NtaA/DmoA family FMN-dependent monooxygenase n=1 Tax=Frankia gtarii TaxID=2950102 RepID=UPI0021BE8AFE|nr:NtaA/DmoA family FMN-dependent monooxygenase [Frankia gtarii]
MTSRRPLHLTVHLVGAASGVHPGAWRWPASDPHTFASIDRWVQAARTAERGLLDAVFLSDVPGLWGDITDHPQEAYFLEPTLVLTAIARATSRIGLIGTASTSFNEPYNIARRFQSLDLISHGRAGWNTVTTFVPVVAENFGGAGIAERPDRYGRGNEFTDVVRALWASWQPGALLADVATGRFTDAERLRPVHHHGEHFDVRGPLPLPPSEQGHPVIFQAGASEPGRDLAARTADAVFSGATTTETARAYAADIRARAAAYGRDPASIAILPGLMTSIGSTEAEAAARLERLDELAYRDGDLARLAARLHLDVATLDPDRPIPPRSLPPLGIEGAVDVLDAGLLERAHRGLTVRALLRPRWTGHLVAAGTPEHVADVIEHWHRVGAADGFTLMPDVIADGLPAFVDHVLPILRRRGLWPHEYGEATLRERLGLPLPDGARQAREAREARR